MDFTPKYRQQDEMFLKWSLAADRETFDVRGIIARLRVMDQGKLSILDVGGGMGVLAKILVEELGDIAVDVVDPSPLARDHFIEHPGVSLIFDDFHRFEPGKNYDAIIFRTVLHHMVGQTEKETYRLQQQALQKASRLLSARGVIFVTENFYDSWRQGDLTGKLIYWLTRSRSLAFLFRRLGANTAGEGVRFKSFSSWVRLFRATGYETVSVTRGPTWRMPLWQKIPLFCAERYQAFLELKLSTPPVAGLSVGPLK